MGNKRKKGKVLSLVMTAAMLLSTLGGVATSTLQVKAAAAVSNPRIADDGTVTWDKIQFGSYYQDVEFTTKQSIKWRILDIDNEGNAFLLADEGLDCIPYNDRRERCTWETCTLRDWLNGTDAYKDNGDAFINAAFNDNERADIIDTVTENNQEDSTAEDNIITDKIYLLSEEEASNNYYGFKERESDDSARQAKATDYAKFHGAFVHKGSGIEGNCHWWLRSLGDNVYGTAYVLNSWVDSDGSGNDDGYNIDGNAVRPALHVNLASPYVSDAGKVKSDGTTVKPSGRGSVGDFSKPDTSGDVITWDCVYFGTYKQKADIKGKQPIEWRVLSVTGDDAFVVADKALDCKPYNTDYKACTWETSTLRDWLNGTDSYNNNDAFINAAFTAEEKNAIIETTVGNAGDSNGTEGGNGIRDRIFLLSKAEATNTAYGFDKNFYSSETRQAKATDYAKINGACASNVSGNCWWWLRTKAYYTSTASFGTGVGSGGGDATDHNYDVFSVRPALHVNLSSSHVKVVGTASAKVSLTADIQEQIKANNVISLISAIGTVTKDSKTAIDKARNTYDALLSETAKAKVTNYSVLQAAEAKYAELTKDDGGNADNTTGNTPATTQAPANTSTEQSVTAPAKVSIISTKNSKKKSIVVKWKKSKNAKGYQLQYASDKKFTKKSKKLTMSKLTYTVKKLKKGNTYYVRVRAYNKGKDGNKVYGKWSAVKRVKIKK